MKKLLLVLGLVIAGCSSQPDWQKSGGTTDTAKDDYECRKEAYATAALAGGPQGANAVAGRDQWRRCMAARGYVDKNK